MANPPHSSFTCEICHLVCKSGRGLTQHRQTAHRHFTPASEDDLDNQVFTTRTHPLLNGAFYYNLLETWLTYSKLNPVIDLATSCH
jgi:hypothetical protein